MKGWIVRPKAATERPQECKIWRLSKVLLRDV